MLQEQEPTGSSCVLVTGCCHTGWLLCSTRYPVTQRLTPPFYRCKNAPQLAQVLEPGWKSRLLVQFDHCYIYIYFLAVLCGLWDFISLTRDQNQAYGSESGRVLTTEPPGNSQLLLFNCGFAVGVRSALCGIGSTVIQKTDAEPLSIRTCEASYIGCRVRSKMKMQVP